MPYPPRLGHLATRKVVAARLGPTYGESHQIDDEEALIRLERALAGRLWEDLLEAAWTELTASSKRLNEEGLLEKIASGLKDRPLRAGRVAKLTPGLSAFLIRADIEAGTATDMARRVLESAEGQRRSAEGLIEAGRHLASELVRK